MVPLRTLGLVSSPMITRSTVTNLLHVPFRSLLWWPVQSERRRSLAIQAREALRLEWDRLRSEAVWDESSVCEWKDVARKATADGIEVHFGYLFAIFVEKNSELPEGHPKRKFKGRVVFQGNRVVNQNWDAAMFQDLGSCPATVEASKAADCYGCAPGFDIEIADAIQAYIQAVLEGTATWVCLPPEERPASWSKFRKPIVHLKKALYDIRIAAPSGRNTVTSTLPLLVLSPFLRSGLRVTSTQL